MSQMIPIGLLTFFFQQGLRGFHEIRYMVIGSFLQLSLKVLLTVAMFALGYRLSGYVAAVAVSSAMSMGWMYLGLRRKVRALPQRDVAPDGDATRQWTRFAAIMYGNSLIGSATGYLDRFLLGFFAGTSPVGVLAVVKQLQQLPSVFLQMFLIVVAPMFSAAHARDDRAQARHLFHLATDWIVRAALPLLIFLAVFAEPLLGLFGDKFAQSGRSALWIFVGAQAVNIACGPIGTLMNMSGHEAMMFRVGLYQSFLSAVLCFMLVPAFGLTGAAIAIATSTVFHYVAVMILARKHLELRWWDSRFGQWLVPGILTLGLALTVFFFSDQRPSTVTMALTLVATYGVFFGTSLARGLNPDDRALIAHLRARLLPRGPS
jgi:O-antigen/teichoic acid export membrane protein